MYTSYRKAHMNSKKMFNIKYSGILCLVLLSSKLNGMDDDSALPRALGCETAGMAIGGLIAGPVGGLMLGLGGGLLSMTADIIREYRIRAKEAKNRALNAKEEALLKDLEKAISGIPCYLDLLRRNIGEEPVSKCNYVAPCELNNKFSLAELQNVQNLLKREKIVCLEHMFNCLHRVAINSKELGLDNLELFRNLERTIMAHSLYAYSNAHAYPLQERAKELEKTKEEQSKDITKLKKDLSEESRLSSQFAPYVGRYNETNAAKEQALEKIKKLQSDLDEAADVQPFIEEKLEELKKQNKAKSELVAKLQENLDEVTNVVPFMEERYQAVTAENEALRSQLKHRRTSSLEKNALIKQLQEELAESKRMQSHQPFQQLMLAHEHGAENNIARQTDESITDEIKIWINDRAEQTERAARSLLNWFKDK